MPSSEPNGALPSTDVGQASEDRFAALLERLRQQGIASPADEHPVAGASISTATDATSARNVMRTHLRDEAGASQSRFSSEEADAINFLSGLMVYRWDALTPSGPAESIGVEEANDTGSDAAMPFAADGSPNAPQSQEATPFLLAMDASVETPANASSSTSSPSNSEPATDSVQKALSGLRNPAQQTVEEDPSYRTHSPAENTGGGASAENVAETSAVLDRGVRQTSETAAPREFSAEGDTATTHTSNDRQSTRFSVDSEVATTPPPVTPSPTPIKRGHAASPSLLTDSAELLDSDNSLEQVSDAIASELTSGTETSTRSSPVVTSQQPAATLGNVATGVAGVSAEASAAQDVSAGPFVNDGPEFGSVMGGSRSRQDEESATSPSGESIDSQALANPAIGNIATALPGSVENAAIPAPTANAIQESVTQQLIEAALARSHVMERFSGAAFELQLTPPELGPLRVEMRRTEAGLSVRIAASSPETRALLDTARQEISQSLQRLDGGDVSFDVFDSPGFGESSGQSMETFADGRSGEGSHEPLRFSSSTGPARDESRTRTADPLNVLA